MTPRRVLSLWQPHATLVAARQPDGSRAKQYESRHFEPRNVVRGITLPIDVVIHATKKWSGEFAASIRRAPFAQPLRAAGYSIEDPRILKGARDISDRLPLPLGCLIAVATIVEVTPAMDLLKHWQSFPEYWKSDFDGGPYYGFALEEKLGLYAAGRFGWKLAAVNELPEPIAFRGRQDVLYQLDGSVNAQIDEQLTRKAA